MDKRKLKSIPVFLLILSFLFSFAPFPAKDTAREASGALPLSASASFTQAPKNDYFSSPAGIFISGSAEERVIYAADKNMGILMYGKGGGIEKIFKRPDSTYKKVFAYQNFAITLENGKLAFFDINKEARPSADYIASDPDNLRNTVLTDIALEGGAVWGVAENSLYKIGVTVSNGAAGLIKQEVYDTGLKNITSVSAAGSGVLLSADHNFGKALYLYDFINTPLRVKDFPDGINDIAVFESGGSSFAAVAHQKSVALIGLPYGDTAASFSPASLPLSKGGIESASFVYVYGGELYVCDTASRAAAVFTLPGLAFKEILFASQGAEQGRLNNPGGICVWDEKLFIADSANKRIQVWDKDGGISVFGNDGEKPLVNPAAVAVDALGRVYVADDNRRIVKYGADYKYISSTEPDAARITGIAASADGIIYVSDSLSGRIMAADAGDDSLVFRGYCDIEKPLSVCASLNLTSVYVLKADGGIARLDKNGDSAARTDLAGENIAAFTVDCRNNIIALRRDSAAESLSIVKLARDGGYEKIKETPFPLVYEYGAYDISRMAFSPASGEIYMADALQSRIYSFASEETGAVRFTDTDRINYESNDALLHYAAAQLTAQTPLYEMPLAAKASELLPRGVSVTVLARDVAGNDYYSFVYLPKTNRAGYVLKSLLGRDNDTDAPLFAEGRVFNDDTPVYKFPSRLAPRIHSGGAELNLPKDKKVKLVPYSKAADADGEKWYCIELDGRGIGFVSAINIANYKYQPTKAVLRTNADIVKSNGDGGASMFEKDGAAILDVPPLTDGCRVQVVGSFNANAKYTEVIYQDDDLGLIQGYVLTKYIKYDTTTNLQFIMLALLVVLAAAVGAAVYIFKRKKARIKR